MLTRIRAWYRRLPLAGKLIGMNLVTSGIVLAVGAVGIDWYNYRFAETRIAATDHTVAGIVGSSATATLTFGDADAARDILQAAVERRNLVGGAVLRLDGTPFTKFQRNGASIASLLATLPADARAGQPWERFDESGLLVAEPIKLGADTIGTVVVFDNLASLRSKHVDSITVAAVLILLGGLALALLVS